MSHGPHKVQAQNQTVLPTNQANGQGRQLAPKDLPTVNILGIPFFNGTVDQAVSRTFLGGLIVAPSGPGLATLDRVPPYRQALLQADLTLIDSGYLAFCHQILRRPKLNRISGLRYLQALLSHPDFLVPEQHLWVMPSQQEARVNLDYLRNNRLPLSPEQAYIAPHYPNTGDIHDHTLLKLIRERRPRFVVINVAGGKQEILGAWLRQQLLANNDPLPALICTGAAIAFLTGQQAPIPTWVDRAYLGWLHRVLHRPGTYARRYLSAIRLLLLLVRETSDHGK